MLTESQITSALRDCYDPELRLNLVELGMIHSVDLRLDPEAPGTGIAGVPARYQVEVTLLRSGSEPDEARAALVSNRLAGLEELSRIRVETLAEPLWSASRISPAGRRLLKLDAPHFPILNNGR